MEDMEKEQQKADNQLRNKTVEESVKARTNNML
jgi:hypothetical protein